jgi:AraC-like DNA-binding protein
VDFDLSKASQKLSELDLKIALDNLYIDVLWFRAMQSTGKATINKHKHSSFEFHFIYSGSTLVELGDVTFTAKAGEFYLTAPGVYHRQTFNSNYIELSLNCDLRLFEDKPSEAVYLLSTLKEAVCKPVKDTTGVTDLFLGVLKEAYFQNAGFYSRIRCLTAAMIIAASRAISGLIPANYQLPHKQRKNEYRIVQIEKFIEDNVMSRLTSSDISKFMYLGEKQISRIITEARGVSTKELILSFKLQKAKKLLIEHSDLTVGQISEILHFSSEYYFNQFFKREEGYPPGVYRKTAKLS